MTIHNVPECETVIVPPLRQYDYRHIAAMHRLSTWSIVTAFIFNGIVMKALAKTDVPEAEAAIWIGVVAVIGLVVIIFSTFCMVRLATSIQFGTIGILFGVICLPVPILCLIPLWFVYCGAGRVLKNAGYKAGFLVPVNMSQFGQKIPVPSTEKWLVVTSIVISISVPMFVAIVRESTQKIKTEVTAERQVAQENILGDSQVDVPLPHIYRNDEYGFSFRYPEDWEEDTDEDERGLIAFILKRGSSSNMGVWRGEQEVRAIYELAKQDFQRAKRMYQRSIKRRDANLKDFRIGTINGEECVFIHEEDTVLEVPLGQITIIFRRKDKVIFAMITDSQTNFDKNRPIFDSMIRSFRFD